MESPFKNDYFSIAYQSYKSFCKQDVEIIMKDREIKDYTCDGSCIIYSEVPKIIIYTDRTIHTQIDSLVHELSHISVGREHEHDTMWTETFNKIFKKFYELCEDFNYVNN